MFVNRLFIENLAEVELVDIMLAAFGLAQTIYQESKMKREASEQGSPFFNAPPALPHPNGGIMLDVTPFILYEKVIINEEWMKDNFYWDEHFFTRSIFNQENIAELLKAGIVEPRGYDADTRRHLDLLEAMTDNDLQDLDIWKTTLLESAQIWWDFSRKIKKNYKILSNVNSIVSPDIFLDLLTRHNYKDLVSYRFYKYHLARLLESDVRSPKIERVFRQAIQRYLLSANNNLLLSAGYAAGFLDWPDSEPFYARKLEIEETGRASATSTVLQGATILSYYLPLGHIRSINELLKVRDRAKGLREYIEAKWRDDQGADEKTFEKILLEIQRAQKQTAYYQKIASYFTLPLGLIPMAGPLLEKLADELIGWGIEKRVLKDYRWHFSLLDYTNIKYDKPTLMVPRQPALSVQEELEYRDGWRRCEGVTRTGTRCKNKASAGSQFCKIHDHPH